MFTLLCAALPNLSFAKDIAENSTDICLNTSSDTTDILQELPAIGWNEIAAEQLTDDDIKAISARMLFNRLGFGEAPKVRWMSEWELIQNSAKGVRRLRALPDAPTRRAFFRHPAGWGVIEVIMQSSQNYAYVECLITVSPELSQESLKLIADQQLTTDSTPIVRSRTRTLSDYPNKVTIGVTYYNPHRVPDLLGLDFPFVGTIMVSNSLKR